MNQPNFYPTKHAVQKMLARDISWEEILFVLDAPEVCYQQSAGPHAGKNTEIRQRGTLYVVVGLTPHFDRHDSAQEFPLIPVITCGLRQTQRWTNDDAKARRR